VTGRSGPVDGLGEICREARFVVLIDFLDVRCSRSTIAVRPSDDINGE
jgi:hypothetical protein